MVFGRHSVMDKWWMHRSSRILLFILPAVKCPIISCSSDSQSCFMWPPSAVQVRLAERQLPFTVTVSAPFNTHIWSLFFFSNRNKKISAYRVVFAFDCGKFLLEWGLDSLFPSVCKLHFVKVITFILHGDFIRLFHGAVQFFRKHRCATHWVVSFSFLFSCFLYCTSVFLILLPCHYFWMLLTLFPACSVFHHFSNAFYFFLFYVYSP